MCSVCQWIWYDLVNWKILPWGEGVTKSSTATFFSSWEAENEWNLKLFVIFEKIK